MHSDDPDEFDLRTIDEERPADALRTEFLGCYPSLAAFVRATLEVLVAPEGWWILDCLNVDEVIARMEDGGRFRFRVADGRVFRDQLPV